LLLEVLTLLTLSGSLSGSNYLIQTMYRSPHILKKSFLLKQVSEMEIKLLLRNDLEPQIHGGRHDGFEYDTEGEIVTLTMS
jgi:hypothetical protein